MQQRFCLPARRAGSENAGGSTNRSRPVDGEHLDEVRAVRQAEYDALYDSLSQELDEAEAAANDLLVRFPEVHDGYDRLGMVYEARGDHKRAAECYRQVIDFVREHPDQYEPEFEETFHRLIAKLDPPAAG